MKKVAQKFGQLLRFSKKLPNVNNRPIGKNWPNLVTLFGAKGGQTRV
jgi:hypothetical protein